MSLYKRQLAIEEATDPFQALDNHVPDEDEKDR